MAGRASRSTEARVLTCEICVATSDTARWFVTHVVISVDGTEISEAKDQLCWGCGGSRECWPLLEVSECIDKYHKDFSYRTEFNVVRAAVAAATARLLKEIHVFSSRSCGVRVSLRAALVPLEAFASHFGMPASSCGYKPVTLPGPENSLVEGILLLRKNLPESLFFHDVELYSNTDRELRTALLAPADIRREGHAPERWSKACKAMVGSRDVQLKASGMAKLLDHTAVQSAIKEKQKERQDADATVQLLQHVSMSQTPAMPAVSCGSSLEADSTTTTRCRHRRQTGAEAPRAPLRAAIDPRRLLRLPRLHACRGQGLGEPYVRGLPFLALPVPKAALRAALLTNLALVAGPAFFL